MIRQQVTLADAERARIAEAVRIAEERSSGEIVCVVAARSDGYGLAAGFTFSAFIIPAAFVIALAGHWLGHDPGGLIVSGATATAWVIGLLGLRFLPALRTLLTPPALKRQRAALNARAQFHAVNAHRTSGRNGVLIFLSLAERYAEIICDISIAGKVPDAEWQTIINSLVASASGGNLAGGLAEAVDAAGNILGRLSPHMGRDTNELPDHVIII